MVKEAYEKIQEMTSLFALQLGQMRRQRKSEREREGEKVRARVNYLAFLVRERATI